MSALVHSNAVATAAAVLIAIGVYGLCLLRFRCFSRQELYDLPFGARIVRLAQRMRLLP